MKSRRSFKAYYREKIFMQREPEEGRKSKKFPGKKKKKLGKGL